MTYDYFYGQQAEMFAFYRVPKVLFTEDCFWNVSTDAKLLYGILLDRMNLSARNGWLDEEGRVYIIFTIEEIKGALGCAEKKAVKLLDELEKKCGLIERKRQGLGKPNLIYVKNFISGSVERQFLNCQKDNSGVVKNTIQELSKAQGNNTDTNYIDFSDTDPFFPSGFCGKEVDETDEFTRYYQYFYEQLSMDYLKQDYPYDHEILDLILHLIIEVMCSNRKQIRIASDDKPIEIVKSSFMKLDSEHIRFVMSSFKENTTDVRNIKQYLLASIYNAPYTISAHYDAKVRHDIEELSSQRNEDYSDRADDYKAAKQALLEGLGLSHLFSGNRKLTPEEKELWLLFDRVYVTELLARDEFAKGAYMLGAEDRETMLR